MSEFIKGNKDKEFERLWKEHMEELRELFKKTHKSKLGRWFNKLEHHDENSIQYKSRKSTASLFFTEGTLFGIKYIPNNTSHNKPYVTSKKNGCK